MDILKIGITAVITAFLCVILRRYNTEYALCCGICGGIILIILATSKIYSLFWVFYDMAEESGIDSGFISIVLKITGIAYVGQFSAEICRDAGETAIAYNVELCAKVLIMVVGIPIVTELFSVVSSIAGIIP